MTFDLQAVVDLSLTVLVTAAIAVAVYLGESGGEP